MTTAQMSLDFAVRPSVRVVLERIREESRDETKQGRWFKRLFMRGTLQEPDFEIDQVWCWPDWPEREALTRLDGHGIGVNLVARRNAGEGVAIQSKCYDDPHVLGKSGVDKFLGRSQQSVFRLRWMVATCRWGPNAESATQNAHPEIKQIDFRQHLDIQLEEQDSKRPAQQWCLFRPSRTQHLGRRSTSPLSLAPKILMYSC